MVVHALVLLPAGGPRDTQERRPEPSAQDEGLAAEEKRIRFQRHDNHDFDPTSDRDHEVNYRSPPPPMNCNTRYRSIENRDGDDFDLASYKDRDVDFHRSPAPMKRTVSTRNRQSDPYYSPRHSQLLPFDFDVESGNLSGGSSDGNHSPALGIHGTYDAAPTVPDSHSNSSSPRLAMNEAPKRSTEEFGDGRHMYAQVIGKPTHQEQLRTKSQHHTNRESRTLPQDVIQIDVYSEPSDVAKWLRQKGFSIGAQHAFRDYTGMDLFQSHVNEFFALLSHEEAIRLDGLLRLQKNKSGYATYSAKELNKILQRRRDHVIGAEMDETRWNISQRQRPPSPDLDEALQTRRRESQRKGPQESGDFKELLIRQRSRLRQSQTGMGKV